MSRSHLDQDEHLLDGYDTAALIAFDSTFAASSSPPFLEASPLSGQQAGLHLLETLMMIADALDQQPPDEDMLQMAFHTLELHINVLFEAEAQLVLTGHAGYFMLNQEQLVISPEQGWQLARCWLRLEQKGLSGVMVMRAATEDELQQFFSQLMSREGVPEATAALYPLSRDNAIARIEAHEREQLARRGMERAVPEGFAVALYAQLLQWVQQRYHPLAQRPSRRIAARCLQELAALCEGHNVFFLGFSAAEGSPHYQAHHITNTAILAMLFGEALGLKRSQRIDLGLITLEHDLGKLDLSPDLLHKSGPLSEDEQSAFALLPLRTARRLLDHRFAWSRLKHALIAIDVHVRPQEGSTDGIEHPQSQAALADSTLLFSRIIRICACFDALCATRPFRPAMAPDQALCFMRGSLSEQFDPQLLRRFVAFLIPAIHTATGRLLHPLPPPSELSGLHRETKSLKLEELQQLLKEYQRHKQHMNGSLQDTEELHRLRDQLIHRLKAAAGQTL